MPDTNIGDEHLFINKITKDDILYTTNLSEMTYEDRYYFYAELLIPNSYFNGNSLNSLNVRFLNCQEDEVNSDNINSIQGVTIYLPKLSTNSNLFTINIQYVNTTGDRVLNQTGIFISNGTDEFTQTINSDYCVISFVIIPKFNNFPNYPEARSELDSGLMMLLNGEQIIFDMNGTRKPVIRVPNFLNNTDNEYDEWIENNKVGATIVVDSSTIDNDGTNTFHIIWNTEFDKFIFKHLALLFYKEYDYDIVTMDSPKYNQMDNGYNQILWTYRNTAQQYYFYSPLILTSQLFKFTDGNGIKLYKLFSISRKDIAGIRDIGFQIKKKTSNNLNNKFNVFEDEYSIEFKEDNRSEEIQDEGLVTIPISTVDVGTEEEDDYLLIYIRKDDSDYKLGYNILKVSNQYDSTIDPNYLDSTLNISLDDYYYYTFEIRNYVDATHTDIIKDLTNKSIINNSEYPMLTMTDEEKNSLIRSGSNSQWKNLFRYTRYIDFSSPLQDNFIVFPLLNLTETENMFVEFILNSVEELNDGVCFAIFDSYTVTGQTDIDPGLTQWNNGFTYAIYPNDSDGYSTRYQVFKDGAEVYKYESTKTSLPIGICFCKKGTAIENKEIGVDSYNIAQHFTDKNINTVFRNIYIHGNGTCNVLMNFGPKSDIPEFQEYIDALMDDDNPPSMQIINSNIVDGNEFYDANDVVGGGTIGKYTAQINVYNTYKTYGENDPNYFADIDGLMYNDDTGTMDSLGNITYVRENSEIEDIGEYYEVLDANVSNSNPNYKIIIRKGNFYILPAYSDELYNSTQGLYNLSLGSSLGGVQTGWDVEMQENSSTTIPFYVECKYDTTFSTLSIVAVKDTVSSENRVDYELYVDNSSLDMGSYEHYHGGTTYWIGGNIILEVEEITNGNDDVNNSINFLLSLDDNPTVEYMAEGNFVLYITK